MELPVVGAVLLSAVLHAGWNAIVKVGGDRWLVPGTIMAVSGLYGALGAAFLPMPMPHHWPWLVASGLLHATYLATLSLAFSVGDFGRVYPIARGTAPLLVFAASAPILGQPVTWQMAACILAIALGIVSLARQRRLPASGAEDRRAVPYALATGALIAAYSLVDAAGIRVLARDIEPAAPTYLCWIMVFAAIPFTAAVVHQRGRAIGPFLRTNGLKGAASAVIAMGSYGLVIWALAQAAAAPVAALRETSVVFGALIAAFVLRERFGMRRIVAAIAVAAGAAGLHLV